MEKSLNSLDLNSFNLNNLDIVEKTTLQLLRDGHTITDISQMLGLHMYPIVDELAYKGILNPDYTFRMTADKF